MQAATSDLRPAVVLDRVTDAAVSDLITVDDRPQSPCFASPARQVLITGPRLLDSTKVFLSLEGSGNERIVIRQVDGVALLAAEIETEPIESLIHRRVPLVTMDRRVVGPGLSDVMIDHVSGMREAIYHLRDLGHQRIAYIGGSSGLTISGHRVSAFHEAMSGAGLTVHPEYIRAGNYRITGGESCMEELFAMNEPPTAIMSANDLTAIGALRAIRRRGLSVPEDFSVVGGDNIDFSDIVQPPLTTLRLSREALADAFYTRAVRVRQRSIRDRPSAQRW